MSYELELNDILLRRFRFPFQYDVKTKLIPHEAFSPSDDDKRIKSPISVNCLRILKDIMNREPLEFTLADKSPENFAVLAINIYAVNCCGTDSNSLTVQSDPVDGNESHCGIHGYPYDSEPKIKKNLRRALASKSWLYEKL